MYTAIVLAALGQLQACQVRGTYRQNAVTRTYTAPAYTQSYAAQSYAAYAPQYETAYVAVQYLPPEYTSIVGEVTRGQNLRKEALLGASNLAARVDRLSASIDGLASRIGQPAVVVQPPAPGKPTPDVPTKGGPDVTPQPPPLPKTNPDVPDDGSVPPPPTVPDPPTPNPGGIAAAPEETALFQRRCQNCHSVAASAKSGGGFALFTEAGDFRSDLTPNEKMDMYFRVKTGNMPRKANPLTPEELATVRGHVSKDPKVKSFLDSLAVKGPN